jgi:RimJ/RimL family protein N-acetyltransferase
MTAFVLRPVRIDEVEMVYGWRNQPDVRAVMHYTKPLDFEAYQKWWPAALKDPTRRMLILDDTQEIVPQPVAMVVFLEVQPRVSAKWGFFTAPRSEVSRFKSLRAWIACEAAAIEYAFDVLGVDALYCDLLDSHTAVLRLHDRAGFASIGWNVNSMDNTRFIEKRLTRSAYQQKRRDPLLARVKAVAIELDPRDRALQGPIA